MARKTEMELDTSELFEAMNLYQKATKKDGADVVNRAAKNAVLGGKGLKGAMQLTKRATVADLRPFNPAKKRAREYSNNLFHALAAEGETRFGKTVRGQGNAAAALKIYNSRKSALGFAKAVWIGIGKKLGAKLRSKFDLPGSRAKKATPVTLKATFQTANIETSLVKDIMEDALQQGINNAAGDMRDYALRKMEARALQFSGDR